MELCDKINSIPASTLHSNTLFHCARWKRCPKLETNGCLKDCHSSIWRKLQNRDRRVSKRRGRWRCSENVSLYKPEVTVGNMTSGKQERASEAERENDFTLVHEKVGSTITRRYLMDDHHQLQIIEEKVGSAANSLHATGGVADQFKFFPLVYIFKPLRDFFLPTDFPESVSHDYMRYMLWQLPTNVTGWICSTLVTSSLLKAVGVGTWAGSTIAATAAIKWVSKDGLGALGRLFIGGRFGRLFDEDPKQWRMYAEFIGSFGSIFELATPIMPNLFLPLATLGNLTKAVGRGLKDPSFRVIQNHFAVSGNMGEVAAKEEVWEVAGELAGIGLGVVLLATPGLETSYSALILTWASIRSLHLWFRYRSLGSLQFPTINFKRALVLVESHVAGFPVPGIFDCNDMENFLVPWQFSRPYLKLGCSLKDALGSDISIRKLEAILSLYSDEQHVIVLHSNMMNKTEIRIVFKEGATSTTILRSMWQAEWLMASDRPQDNTKGTLFSGQEDYSLKSQMSILEMSLKELNRKFHSFMYEIEQAGWEIDKIILKAPRDAPSLSTAFSKQYHSQSEKI